MKNSGPLRKDKTKLVYIISDIDKALAFEWLTIRLRAKFELAFILMGKRNSGLALWLKENHVNLYEIADNQFPSKFSKWFQVFRILKNKRPDIIHTHLWIANLLGLSAAWLLGVKRRIFTRHHAMIHYDEFPSGRKWDRLCNYLATDIVAISRNIESILITKDKASSEKVKIIHHGFDIKYFESVSEERVETIRTKYRIDKNDSPVIGVIARYMKWKGVEYIIRAFKLLMENYPQAKLVLANAQGDYATQIQNELRALPESSFIEISFEDDLAALYKVFNIYVHAPHDAFSEAFGQTYVEALISGVPSIFTLSGIAKEFILNEKNAVVVPYRDSEAIHAAIKKLWLDKHLQEKLILYGKETGRQFSLDRMITSLENLYND
jgi:glycosyltransferase involved in cell wall biosynthesis